MSVKNNLKTKVAFSLFILLLLTWMFFGKNRTQDQQTDPVSRHRNADSDIAKKPEIPESHQAARVSESPSSVSLAEKSEDPGTDVATDNNVAAQDVEADDSADREASQPKAEYKPSQPAIEGGDPAKFARSRVGFAKDYPIKAPAHRIEKELVGSFEGDLMIGQKKVGRLALSIQGVLDRDVFDGEIEITEFNEKGSPRLKARMTKDLGHSIREIEENGIKSFLIFSTKNDDEDTVFQIRKSGNDMIGNLYRTNETERLKYESSFVLHPAS